MKSGIKYALIHVSGKQVLESNHVYPGSAWNSKQLDYINNKNIIVVKTHDDVILGEVNRKGILLKDQSILSRLPKNIWEW